MVLNPQTDLVSPQFHVGFDDNQWTMCGLQTSFVPDLLTTPPCQEDGSFSLHSDVLLKESTSPESMLPSSARGASSPIMQAYTLGSFYLRLILSQFLGENLLFSQLQTQHSHVGYNQWKNQ